jgi:hypothetical protein
MYRYLKFNSTIYFIILSSIAILMTFLSHRILLNDNFYYISLSDTIIQDRIPFLISQQRLVQKIGYFFIPIVIILRAFYVSCCLYTGCFVAQNKITFNQCMNISLKADIVFLFEIIIKIYYLLFLGFSSLEEFNMRPFSLYQLLGGNIESWATYPFFVFNVFELFYWTLLASFLSQYTNEGFWKSLLFIYKTYGLGLLIWIVLVLFINVSMLQ